MNVKLGRTARRAGLGLAAMLAYTIGAAQEGYPLDGTWRGMRGETNPEQIVIVMEWDGQTINGTISPGPNARPFQSASLDPETWTLRIEAESAEGAPITIQGRLEDIGAYNRTVTGTWTEGGREYAFKMTRQ